MAGLCLGECFLAAFGVDGGAGPSFDGAAQDLGEAAKLTALCFHRQG